jgi:RNA recognition motif-containing protein
MDSMNLRGKYDFVYLPIDFRSGSGLGYAFVNMISVADAEKVWECFEGFKNWDEKNGKVCTVSWSTPHQGCADHVDRYRNSPVMHPSVPEAWQPALFVHGVRASFPAPTKKLKAPKFKELSKGS